MQTSLPCPACGAELDAQAPFCSRCGKRRILAAKSAPSWLPYAVVAVLLVWIAWQAGAEGAAILVGLGISAGLPLVAARGTGWRGLWFGFSAAAFVLALILNQPDSAADLQRYPPSEWPAIRAVGFVMFCAAAGSALGCFLAGCFYRK